MKQVFFSKVPCNELRDKMFPAGVLQDGAAVLLRERQHGEILGDGKGQWLKVHIHLPKGGCKMLEKTTLKTHHYHWEDPTLRTVFLSSKVWPNKLFEKLARKARKAP